MYKYAYRYINVSHSVQMFRKNKWIYEIIKINTENMSEICIFTLISSK